MKPLCPSKFHPWLFCLAALVVLAGCNRGPKTYHLTGTITYQGKPVPVGNIMFEPETGGQPGFAKIKDGKYDTSLEGQGVLGGPHRVTITGLDGIQRGELLNGIQLFPDYRTTADLPASDAVQDFEVPAGGKGG